jgi:hypothetical protein
MIILSYTIQEPRPKLKLFIKGSLDRDLPMPEQLVRDMLNGLHDKDMLKKVGDQRRLIGVDNRHCYLFELDDTVQLGQFSPSGLLLNSREKLDLLVIKDYAVPLCFVLLPSLYDRLQNVSY